MSLPCSKIKLLGEHFNSVLFSSGKPRASFHNGLSMTLSWKSFYSLFCFVLQFFFEGGGGGEGGAGVGKKRLLEPNRTTFCESHCFITVVPKFSAGRIFESTAL